MASIRSITSHSSAPSLWQAYCEEPATLAPSLSEMQLVDVVVIGAGVTGLSTALHLAERGVSVCVLDAHPVGWGASGRNGGQVNPTLKHDPVELTRMLGDRAEPMIAAISASADLVFSLIDVHGIRCHPIRAGWLQLTYRDSGVSFLHARASQWAERGADVALLDANAAHAHTGTSVFKGGWWDKRAGSIQPLAFVRGLARAAQQAGVQVHGESPVRHLQREGSDWLVVTVPGVRVRAQNVVLATNGYSDALWPGVARTILAANSFMVATRPMGDAAAHILPQGETLSTAERLLVYLRKDAAGRLLLGGRGLFADPTSSKDFAHIERALVRLYPDLAPFTFEYRWGGRIAITRDFMPHVHRPAPGVFVALGYNGRGVAAGTLMGQQLAGLISGGSERDFPFPITSLRAIPLHGLQRFTISAGVAWYGLLDTLGVGGGG